MTEKIMEGIYKIEIPLPDNPLGSLNAYLILGENRNLLIDTGFCHPVCRNAMLDGFRQIGVPLSNTDIFLTHLHADHTGLASELADRGARIYCSELDGNIVNFFASPEYWDEMSVLFSQHGMPDIKNDEDKGVHPGKLFGGRGPMDFSSVMDGDILSIGKYRLRCIWTPGHTPGHMCLYDEHEKLLFSGDHVLGNITPVISPEKGMNRPLGLYLESLERIGRLEINEILTGHRGRVNHPYQRIEELKEHHRRRLEEIIHILSAADFSMNAYDVAAGMKWKMRKNEWGKVPRQQRWFATGEAIAHLLYLEEKGLADCSFQDGSYGFSLKRPTGKEAFL